MIEINVIMLFQANWLFLTNEFVWIEPAKASSGGIFVRHVPGLSELEGIEFSGLNKL